VSLFINLSLERLTDLVEHRAEYMLDVIGAGATATSEKDWHAIWKAAPESHKVQAEIKAIIEEGRSRPAITTEIRSEFSTSWMFQAKELFMRNVRSYWRDPTYLMAKLALNVCGGLFIGFTFWKSKDTQQGTQNKLFVRPLLFKS